MRLQFGLSTFLRTYAGAPEIALYNRFFEQNPTNQSDGVALLSRPGSTLLNTPGDGPIRGNFNMKGIHDGDLFTASKDALFRFDGNTETPITGTLNQDGFIRFAGARGADYQRIFIADGQTLQYYGGQAYQATLTLTPGVIADDVVRVDDTYYQFAADPTIFGAATGTLTLTPGAIADDVIRIGSTYYQWVNDSTPADGAGTLASPYLVDNGASDTDAFANMLAAINASGTPGTTYSTSLVVHPSVEAVSSNATTLVVRSKQPGVSQNTIVTTVTATGGADGLAWGSGTLTGGVDVDGSAAAPYQVDTGASNADALSNLRKAINASGVEGTDYSFGVVANDRVTATANTGTTVVVRGATAGPLDPIAVVSVTATGGSDGLAWDAGSLQPGPHVLYGVPTPDDVGIIAVTVLDSFVLCVVANSARVYFIRPGETTIDPLDFFEAESEPDELLDAITVGSQVWLLGRSSIEPWYNSGADPIPFARMDGSPISRGTIQGTPVKLANSIILVGDDNIVYQVSNGAEPISTPAISERIRKAREIEKANA